MFHLLLLDDHLKVILEAFLAERAGAPRHRDHLGNKEDSLYLCVHLYIDSGEKRVCKGI